MLPLLERTRPPRETPPAEPKRSNEFLLGLARPAADTSQVTPLIQSLAAELERPRQLPAQVVNHLSGTYGIDRDAIGPFLVNELPKLEDYEIDLALSPVFTPTLNDQAVFADLLGQESVPATQWPALIQQLVARPTRAQLAANDGQVNAVPLREVSLERYVHRLRLDATIPDALFKLIADSAPAADRPVLKAIARRAVWENDARRNILVRYLTATADSDSYRLADVVELLKLAEIYQPADVASLLAQIPHWQQVLRAEINEAASPKPFFNERVQEMHGGERDRRRQDEPRMIAKENERAFLDRLQQVLAE